MNTDNNRFILRPYSDFFDNDILYSVMKNDGRNGWEGIQVT